LAGLAPLEAEHFEPLASVHEVFQRKRLQAHATRKIFGLFASKSYSPSLRDRIFFGE